MSTIPNKLLFTLLAFLLSGASPVVAEDDPLETLGFIASSTEETASTSRIPRPLSKTAENITVVTAADIARLNAHTLAEVLQTVTGIQLNEVQTPGGSTSFSVNGAIATFLQVMIDGAPQSSPSFLGDFPVQFIERIEIVKGATSTNWGHALGGVINIITKSPNPDKPYSGTASASYGERATSDFTGELSGTTGRFGYYLSGGKLNSSGLRPGNNVDFDHVFGKFTYLLPSNGKLSLSLDYRDTFKGLYESAMIDTKGTVRYRYLTSHLTLTQPLAENLSLELSARMASKDFWQKMGYVSKQSFFLDYTGKEESRWASARLNWGSTDANMAVGLEYTNDDIKLLEPISRFYYANGSRKYDRYASFLNGLFSIGDFTILPEIRYDITGTGDNTFSYSLGMTYKLSATTLLRLHGAKGYSLPLIFTSNKLQHIWTVQAGIESNAVPYLWLKGMVFYNDTWKIEQLSASNPYTVPANNTYVARIQRGFELEARTVPLYGFSLSGGFTCTTLSPNYQANDMKWGEMPLWGAKVAVKYDNAALGLLGTVTGNYVNWASSAGSQVKDSDGIWDLHLNQKLKPASPHSPVLFFSVRNIFNGSQYLKEYRQNAPRWFEGGIRVNF